MSHSKTDHGIRFTVDDVEICKKLLVPINSNTQSLVQNLVDKINPNNSSSIDASYRRKKKEKGHVIEAHSFLDDQKHVIQAIGNYNGNGLMNLALFAFANHYPLKLSPDDIWLPIALGVSQHINENAEKLRDRFVSHQGKKKLWIRNDDMEMGHMSPKFWEEEIFSVFTNQIREHIGEEIFNLFTENYSTTTPAHNAASQVSLMFAMEKYFSFRVFTKCGIPWIELAGTEDDWVKLRDRAKKLENVLLPDFAQQWIPHLVSVLDEFVAAYRGEVNRGFWQRMCKRVEGKMSGESDAVSGWINNLYPYLEEKAPNPYVGSWKELNTFRGPDPERFPAVRMSVPVIWEYYDVKYPMRFITGYMGVLQDDKTSALQPLVGWIISHDSKEETSEEKAKKIA